MDVARKYRYLNREGRWADFEHRGLELRQDGTLRLRSVPRFHGDPPPELADLPAPTGLAGVAAVPGGHVYFTDPDSNQLLLVDGCDGTRRPAACSTGRGGHGPGELCAPRGLALHVRRGALLVADSGNDRVQLLALPDLEVSETWDARDRPTSLAYAADGRVYAVDDGSGRVVELDVLGRASDDFWDAVLAQAQIAASEVAVTLAGGRPLVLVLDRDGRVHVIEQDGHRTTWWRTDLAEPLGLAALGDTVLVGDNATRRLVAFELSGRRTGAAYGYAGPVAAAAADRHGDVLVHPGDGVSPLRLAGTGAYAARGVLWGGPFRNPSDASEPRHLLRARVEDAGYGGHLRLHYHRQSPPADPEQPPPVDPDAVDPFADPRWTHVAPEASETLFGGEPGDAVWVGMTLSSEGLGSPVLEQIRIDFDHPTWLVHLPAVYQRDPAPDDVLARWLTLFESTFDEVHEAIEGLPRLFDPAVSPSRWLPWLAGWLGAEAPEVWGDERRRRLIATAFARGGRRGTAVGLREALRADAGLEAVVEEPIRQTGWWALPADDATEVEASLSVLGHATVLAVGEPSGAVLGSSAVLDGSFLAPQDRYATALFTDVAHQFSVRLYRGPTYSENAVTAARGVIDAERPAHTTYHLCVVEPRMRVGVQARVGVDAIVAEPGERIPSDAAEEGGLLLGGDPVGRLGRTTHLGRIHL